MFAAGMPLPKEIYAPTNDWNIALIALIAVAVLIVVGAMYGWIVSRFVTPVKARPTAVTRAIQRAERKAA